MDNQDYLEWQDALEAKELKDRLEFMKNMFFATKADKKAIMLEMQMTEGKLAQLIGGDEIVVQETNTKGKGFKRKKKK